MEFRNLSLILIALLTPLLGSWLVIQSQFWAGTIVANGAACFFLPFVGGAFLSKVGFHSQKGKKIAVTIFILTMIVAVWFIVLLTSCFNGDCI
jgi:peptidoglycan/LPS O-acetylase OafA/YrhL